MTEESYKRGDMVEFPDGHVGLVAGWMGKDTVCILDPVSGKSWATGAVALIRRIAEAGEFEQLFPKDLEVYLTRPS